MRRALLALAALGTGCATGVEPPTAAPPAVAAPVALRNAGFEDPMGAGDRCPRGWGCTMHNNPEAFRFALAASGASEGSRSLCVERVADEPWALVTQRVPIERLRGARVRLSMMVRGEGLTGPGIGPWMLVAGRQRAHDSRVVTAAGEWRRVAVEMAIPPAATSLEAGATLEGGGKACIDDVRLEVVEGQEAGKP